VTDPRSLGESGSRYLGNPGSISKKFSYKLIVMNAWKKSDISRRACDFMDTTGARRRERGTD
jgi:hypothetical protein